MVTPRSKSDRQRLIAYLESLPENSAIRVICLLTLGAIDAIRNDYSLWPCAQSVVFNATVLLFCRDRLRNEEAAEMINYAIQIEDLKGFTADPVPFGRITRDVEARAMRLLSRHAADRN